MKILGISAYYHDSAAAIIVDGRIIAAAQQERFSRIKHDAGFPTEAINYCLDEACIKVNNLDAIVFYDKPFLKFERILQTFLENAPFGWWKFTQAMPEWLKEKLFIKGEIKKALEDVGQVNWKHTKLLFSKHHLSHAASTFFPSPFKEAAILTIDGVGEYATASIAKGDGNSIEQLEELHFPHSLGLLYSAFTYFLGFKVNSGEYKLMGLAPYADNSAPEVKVFVELITTEIVKIHPDGSMELNPKYFKFGLGNKMVKLTAFEELFGFQRRKEETSIRKEHIFLAKAIQLVLEDIVLKMAGKAKELTMSDNLCLAGGVALNCVANGRLKEEKIFKNIYVQPAAGDAGNALGAALSAYHMYYERERPTIDKFDLMNSSRLGPSFSDKEILYALKSQGLEYKYLAEDDLLEYVVDALLNESSIGWFQGRMEFGPRALGSRSILGNPLSSETQSKLNLKVKHRESFRPFAPLMLQEEFEKYFGQSYASPYMLFVHKILDDYRVERKVFSENLIDVIHERRSVLPAISHVDYSSRIQTVSKEDDLRMFKLLSRFKEKTGFGVLVNTSFNLRGEPIVCSPDDAINTFLSTELDCLALGNYLVEREKNLASLKKDVKIKLD